MQNSQAYKIFDNCLKQLKKQDYIGYDPADLMNTTLNFIKKLPSPIIRFLTIINFLSPINFRGLLKIKPTKNTTAMVVMARALLNVYKKTNNIEYLLEAQNLEQWMIQNSVVNEDTIGWARVIQYQTRINFQHTSQSTLTFINAYALEMYIDLYQLTRNNYYFDISKKISQHIINYTNRISYSFGCCLSYINDAHEEILNASILAGAALNRYSHIANDTKALELSLNILDYTIYRQNINGSWEYSYKNNKKPKRQYDFHQCYMLDGIMKYDLNNDPERVQKVKVSFSIGMSFYINYQFDKKMRPYWRYPIKYPIDIHNVSHAIFFVSKYFNDISEATIKLDKLLSMLYDDYYDHNNYYFYYQKYPLLKVKHNFFRWNTVWTLYALSHLNFK